MGIGFNHAPQCGNGDWRWMVRSKRCPLAHGLAAAPVFFTRAAPFVEQVEAIVATASFMKYGSSDTKPITVSTVGIKVLKH